MKTNEVEKQTGLSKQTILHYEKEGLLHPKREENGYRDYTQEDVQILMMIKFLRNLQVSVDDIRLVLDGSLTLKEIMKIQEDYLTDHVEQLNELQQKVKQLVTREVPLLPQMEEIAVLDKHTFLGFHRANDHVTIGRRASKDLIKRRVRIFLLQMLGIAVLGYISCYIVLHRFVEWYVYVPIAIVFFLMECVIFLKFGTEGDSPYLNMSFIFNINEPFMELVEDHVMYQKERKFLENVHYLWDVMHGHGERWIHQATYEDIQMVKLVARQRWMNAAGGSIAIPWIVPCMTVIFQYGDRLYLEIPMMLDDDAKWAASILQAKVKQIEDPANVLGLWKEGKNLNEALLGREDIVTYF